MKSAVRLGGFPIRYSDDDVYTIPIRSTRRHRIRKSYSRYLDIRPPSNTMTLKTRGQISKLQNASELIGRIFEAESSMSSRVSVNKLKRSIDRFEGATKRTDWRDSAIDMGVILESFFSDATNEISYRLKMRTAILLGTNVEKSDKLYKTVLELYNLRNSVAHGGRQTQDSVKLARRVVKAWLGEQSTPVHDRIALGTANRIGAEIVGDCIRAFMALILDGRFDPFSNDFLETVDRAAFNARKRLELQRAADIR